MKIITIFMKPALGITAFCLILAACNSLDITNRESYDESMVWSDANLATAYVNNLYAECFPNWNSSADQNSDELQGIPWKLGYITESGSDYKRWTYSEIRDINEAIQMLEKSDLEKDVVDGLLGQVYFMRAYMYYWMVIYHGGVPYIKVPQDYKKDDLLVQRNTSAEGAPGSYPLRCKVVTTKQ